MGYNPRGGPNVSEFVANLNAIPPTQEMAGQAQDSFNLDAELAMFTNSQFFDFDLGQDADLQPGNLGFAQSRTATVTGNTEGENLDFLSGDFTFPEFHPYPSSEGFSNDGLSLAATHGNPTNPGYTASSTSSPPSGLISPQNGEKRKADAMSDASHPNFEDSSRVAAEEDKRRRNTAASARFRVKKKQREQALEKSAKEMTDKVAALEGRINLLETENKWLKNLIMEKTENKDDIGALWKKYRETAERKAAERKDGVGTAKKA